MTLYSNQREMYEAGVQPQQFQSFITIGTIVDTNDPQQMGRVRVVCTQWGDSFQSNVEDIPWALYMPSFGGQRQVGTRGPGIQDSVGGIAYGQWMIPDVGAQAVVACVDGNPTHRVYIGCVYDQFVPHTMPHGRFMYEDHPELEKKGDDAAPYGPYTSSEEFIQPLADNIKQAFGNQGEPNYEYRNRGADYSATRVDVSDLGQSWSQVQDDKDVVHDDWVSTQGYQKSRVDPDAPSSFTDKNYDNMVYSITSPGFHSMSMDDRQENCRMRFRTTSGHQIIMDDTNERIYIATAQGNNWIELDQDGNVDIFTTNKVNIRSQKDINLTSDETIRMHAKKGIHMYSDEEIRMEAQQDIHVRTPQNIRTHSEQSTFIQAEGNIHIKTAAAMYLESASEMNAKTSDSLYLESAVKLNAKAGEALNLEAGAQVNAKAGAALNLEAGAQMNLLAAGDIVETGTDIQLNGAPADPADSADSANPAEPANEENAFWTNRVPDHEPWARVMTKDDFTHDPEFEYDDRSVNKSERGRTIERGQYWRR